MPLLYVYVNGLDSKVNLRKFCQIRGEVHQQGGRGCPALYLTNYTLVGEIKPAVEFRQHLKNVARFQIQFFPCLFMAQFISINSN